jgi:ABC-type branched-subunit amino acid transport system ATPase component
MLKVSNLGKSFGGVAAVHDCDFEVDSNSITALIGPNGAGKTTVFNLITGFISPDKGSIRFKNRSVVGKKPHEIANLGITRTFQLIRLFPKLTVMENLLLAEHQIGENFFAAIFKPKKTRAEERRRRKRCMGFLKLVSLEQKANELAEELSYGQQKLVEIARVLATESELILLDEPVAGVNPVMRERIKQVLRQLQKAGKTILLIEHDMKFVMDVCDKVVVLDYGEEIAVGTPDEVMGDKRVLEAYLGVDSKELVMDE